MASRQFHVRTRIDVPADVAFAFLADPSTATEIDPAVRSYVPDTLPMSEGTRVDLRFAMWGLPVRARSIVRVWEPGRTMVMENLSPSWPVRVVATHSFEPHGEACVYEWAMEIHSAGPMSGLLAGVVTRFMRRNAAGQIVLFKTAVERDASDPAGPVPRASPRGHP